MVKIHSEDTTQESDMYQGTDLFTFDDENKNCIIRMDFVPIKSTVMKRKPRRKLVVS